MLSVQNHNQKQPPEGELQENCSGRFCKIDNKTLFDKVPDCNLQLIRSKYRIEQIKMDFVCVQYRYLAFNFNECLRNLANL